MTNLWGVSIKGTIKEFMNILIVGVAKETVFLEKRS